MPSHSPSRSTGTGPQLPDDGFRRVQLRGLNFRVFEQGQGVPLLLLHGFPDGVELWAGMVPTLVAAGYRVIAFDQRGYGESDAPSGARHYSTDELAADVAALLDSLGISEPICLLGHDWGSGVAWSFTLAYPQRVRALVAVSVGHPKSYGKAGVEQKFVKGLYILWFQLRGLCEWYLLRAGGMRRWLGGSNDYAGVMARMERPGRLTAGLNWYRANFLRIMRAVWPNAQRPVLGVWSSGDIYLTEAQMRGSERYVDAEWAYRRIEGCSHWIPLERPQQLAELAMGWFHRHGAEPLASPERRAG